MNDPVNHLSELRLSSSILPHQWPRLETVTTRPGGAPCPEADRTMSGASRLARRKWPKWLEAMCSSRLSSVMYLFVSATPAFSIYRVVVVVVKVRHVYYSKYTQYGLQRTRWMSLLLTAIQNTQGYFNVSKF